MDKNSKYLHDDLVAIEKKEILEEFFRNVIRARYNIFFKKMNYWELLDTHEFVKFRNNNPSLAELITLIVRNLKKRTYITNQTIASKGEKN